MMMTTQRNKSRLDKLERAISPETRQPTYISVDLETWESGDIVVGRPGLKCYIGISPDDWDNQETSTPD